MAVAPLAGATAALPALPSLPTRPVEPAAGFGDRLVGALDDLNAVQSKADDLALQAATGQAVDVHDYMVAATSASLATELTVAVRNKALEAFTSIMQMPI